MFRIVQAASRGIDPETQQPVPPYFWLICDERKCGVNSQRGHPASG